MLIPVGTAFGNGPRNTTALGFPAMSRFSPPHISSNGLFVISSPYGCLKPELQC